MPIDGNGNCFFTSVAALLALVRNQDGKQHNLDETELRRRVIEWLRNCGGQIGDAFEDCMCHMQAELKHSVTCLCLSLNKRVERKPQNIAEYLDMSSQDGVWVAGRTPAIHHRHHHIPPAYTTTEHHHCPPPYTACCHRVPLANRGGNLVQGLCGRGDSQARPRALLWGHGAPAHSPLQ
jgi:hypothetical protein